jgi:hypothetical protein
MHGLGARQRKRLAVRDHCRTRLNGPNRLPDYPWFVIRCWRPTLSLSGRTILAVRSSAFSHHEGPRTSLCTHKFSAGAGIFIRFDLRASDSITLPVFTTLGGDQSRNSPTMRAFRAPSTRLRAPHPGNCLEHETIAKDPPNKCTPQCSFVSWAQRCGCKEATSGCGCGRVVNSWSESDRHRRSNNELR